MNDRVDRLLGQWSHERPELDCSGLDVIARVQDAAKLLRRDEDEALEALKLKMWEYDVLSALRRQGDGCSLPATVLARESLLSSGAMTHRIDRLAKRGLVSRKSGIEDRRSVLVALTAAGRELADRALEARLTLADLHVAGLTDKERASISSGLRKLMAAMS